jgi:hypothetical protein
MAMNANENGQKTVTVGELQKLLELWEDRSGRSVYGVEVDAIGDCMADVKALISSK